MSDKAAHLSFKTTKSSIPWLTRLQKPTRQRAKNAIASVAPVSEEHLGFWLRPAVWFWAAIFIGFALRAYLVVFTQGTYDVGIWEAHAAGVHKEGLINYYHTNIDMNHPPFIAVIISWLWSIAQSSGIAFRILLRAPFAMLDGGTALLLLRVLHNSRYRFVVTACYWLHPLSIIFSAYHGNTDSSMAFFLMLCFYLLSKRKIILAAVSMGISLWVKLPAVLAIPAFLFFLPDGRRRLQFFCTVGIAAVVTYLPTLLDDPAVICKNVFGYHGQIIQTTSGIPVWGTRIFISYFQYLSYQWQRQLYQPVTFYASHNSLFCIVPIIFLSWLRRSKRTVPELGLTIAGVYTILYGFSNYWSFQYFAWSIPFWFFARPRFVISATLLAGGYIYALYWLLCGNPWLLGVWDFAGHPYWPKFLELFRNFALLFFFLSALVFLIRSTFEEISRWYRRMRNHSCGRKTSKSLL
jgi:Gpi18-like mannosyltransferase